MPTPNTTLDVELLTLPQGGRTPRFIRRPRRIGGRNVPGNARFFRDRNRARDTLAGRQARRRADEARARTARTAREVTRTPESVAPPSAGQRRGGLGSRVRRAVSRAARGVQRRRSSRRSAG